MKQMQFNVINLSLNCRSSFNQTTSAKTKTKRAIRHRLLYFLLAIITANDVKKNSGMMVHDGNSGIITGFISG
jgi:hypothetical protein